MVVQGVRCCGGGTGCRVMWFVHTLCVLVSFRGVLMCLSQVGCSVVFFCAAM